MASGHGPRKKIVVVDDDPGMLEFMSFILADDYEVTTAPDGAAGLEIIRAVKPELAILDLLMPRMHGFEVCQKLKQDAALKGVKVLISSSKSYSHDIATAKQAGADNYIVKPFQAADLLGQVSELIGDVQTALELKFWGTRGSLPAPGPLTQRYGGNTPCVELRVGELLIIIDAGTGIRELGLSLMKEFGPRPITGHIFIGHTHWDHIQGFPFFVPAYLPQNRFTIYGMHGTTQSFEEVFTQQMAPSYFPIAMDKMPSKLQISELTGPVKLGPVRVSYHFLNHPGMTVGFRFDAANWSVCYVSDHEPYAKLNEKGEFSDREDALLAKFVAGADLLISEAQYTDEEYKYKRTWGHSTFTDVLDLAIKAKVKQLALFHHDPTHTDEEMDRHLAESREYLAKKGSSVTCFAAQDGLGLKL